MNLSFQTLRVMRGLWIRSEFFILILLLNFLFKTDARNFNSKSKLSGANQVNGYQKFAERSAGEKRRTVTEEEISYIASTLQPRECLSLLYLLRHPYIRRRKRETGIEEEKAKSKVRSAQITPCETMLLNYWRDPSVKLKKDYSHVSRTLRQVKRQDLARWLCGRRPSFNGRTVFLNGTNDASSLSAEMQVIPIYSSRTSAPPVQPEISNDSTSSLVDSIIWIYIALAVSATTALLLCTHYLFRKFRKSSQYIALADKDIRNLQYACSCIDKGLSIPCNKKKRCQPPGLGCGCTARN